MSENKPLVVSDIKPYLLFKYDNKEDVYCIGSLEKDKYIEVNQKLKDKILNVISYFDGENTLDDIKYKLENKDKIKINVDKLYNLLNKSGLIENSNNINIEKNEYEKYGVNILTLELKKFYNFFKFLSKYINFIIFISIFIIIISIPNFILVLKQMLYLNIFKIVNSSTLSVIISISITTLSVIFHEFSHAIVATRFGLKPKKFKVSLYLYLNPIAYIIIPGIYTIERKKRIYIWLAGVYCNLLILSSSILLQKITTGVVHNIFMVTCYSNLGLMIGNLVPFLPLDGYFVLSTLLKIPNLRKKSFKSFKSFLKFNPKSNSKSFKGIYLCYFTVSVIMILYLIFSQFSQMYYNFMIGWRINNNVLDGINEIKIYVLIMMMSLYSIIRPKLKHNRKVSCTNTFSN
ncbi:M50 family metallopeptidase [Clostridium pasteurianum]|uniref:Zn-dependent protease n=1 Tax=Clostridium pasteurianum BC1 TaxID=86416 RepID=R4K7Z8_CLOPA|nr:M50 family metallopeptidase [Clostridium pasteurianum]AGK96634.1 Zn-dependent protease [Clostridium pasteurianum BC1]